MTPDRDGARAPVRAWAEELVLPTYLPAAPDRHPMFLEKRVYQGSSGKVYPLPVTDRIADRPVPRAWRAVWLENDYLRVLVLPELGGRIHRMLDRMNGYDLIYYQPVIKPALVGLAGPWISGGIEFNWPQHHRPATFMPVAYDIEQHADGAITVWCSDHDPMARMKGMHGICLRPGRAWVELRVRAYNRTPWVQTFLWWANVATRVHERYQSFFPPDVQYVADHARRSMTEFPLARGHYYGIDYGKRPGRNDLSFYANIPTPCSYMVLGSKGDFFGGYDAQARAGLVHWANHHIAPGKKQWTWGNSPFGYAWDRNLTDPDEQGEHRPYIELMAGVYTDNQPDFSFLQPGETKAWSQYWYPIQEIGPVHAANLDVAVSLSLRAKEFSLGICVTRPVPRAVVSLERADGSACAEWDADLAPGKPLVLRSPQPVKPWRVGATVLRVRDAEGRELISFRPERRRQRPVPPPATEPLRPNQMASNDELFLTGVHLEQYRHATRCPTAYWHEGLRRDPQDSRCHLALGKWHLRRGEWAEAERHLRACIARLTSRNANPADGEPFFTLGWCLRHQGRDDEAYDAFYKATWNQGWAGAGYHALAQIDAERRHWATALAHVERALRLDADHLQARNLRVLVLRELGQRDEAAAALRETRQLDRLDAWACHLAGETRWTDAQMALDVAHDCAWAGFWEEAIQLLRGLDLGRTAWPDQGWGAEPLVHFTLGWLEEQAGRPEIGKQDYQRGNRVAADYCFPARVEEMGILQAAMRACPGAGRASYLLGNLLYDRRRHQEAISYWERAVLLEPKNAVAWRNLGMGYFNIQRKPRKARQAYERAVQAAPGEARLVYERDQLWKRMGEKPARRWRELAARRGLVDQRDDLSLEWITLLNQLGRAEEALAALQARRFQPWEGGEGGPLGQHTCCHLVLGRQALDRGEADRAREHFEMALAAPSHLGEARHELANASDVHYWLGCAWQALGRREQARAAWRAAATFRGDFQNMSVRTISEMTFYSALAWQRLGRPATARRLFCELLDYARELRRAPARIDYFATSLPTLLLFEEDLSFRQETTALFLAAQAHLGLGETRRAQRLVAQVLNRDPNHAGAAQLLHTRPR